MKGSESASVTSKSRKFTGAEMGDVSISVEDGRCPSNSAIYIRNLCKSYGNTDILRNFCMNVPKGTIYGFLGASGCGKTTVLSTIVGLQKWDSGDVFVLGESPGNAGKRLGYVPQEAALFDQLTLREVMEFYRRMYSMPSQEVAEKYVSLTKLLDFPTNFKLIGNMSGGQKRRASLAVALMHSPSLLVLDEPTVGLDPLLRTRIWNHLHDLVSTSNTTVIITTHYLEETRFSNTIGVIRKGRLLVEDSPTNLLNTFKSDLLEDVILQICRKDESTLKKLELNEGQSNFERNEHVLKPKWRKEKTSALAIRNNDLIYGTFRKASDFDFESNRDSCHKMDNEKIDTDAVESEWRNSLIYQRIQRIRALSTVLLLTFSRHPLFIALILFVPTLHATLSLDILGSKPIGLRFGVVNKEVSNWTTECDTRKHHSNSCDFSALSCKYLNQLKGNDLFQMTAYEDETTALEGVKMGRSWGYIVFGQNYSQDNFDFMAAKRFATNESIEGRRINVHLDYSQYIVSFFLVKDLNSAIIDYIRELAHACAIGGKEAEVPLNFRDSIYGASADNNTNYLIPSVLMCCMMCILGMLASLVFINDRKQGNLSRAHVAGLRTVEILLSHMVTQGLVGLLQILIWTVLLHTFFEFAINGPIWLYLVILLLNALCSAATGLLLGIVSTDEKEALFWIALFWGPILLLFGGLFWPIEAMPWYCQQIGYLLPTTLPIMSLRSVITRGLSIDHDLVWPGVLASLGWTVAVSICIIFCYKRHAK